MRPAMQRTFLWIFLAVVIPFGGILKAQDTKKEVYDKIHIPYKKPIPNPYTREADVMWSKVVWRMIDLREKANLPLYYPVKPIGERMSLIHLIFYGIDNEGLVVYDPDMEGGNDEFKFQMNTEKINKTMGAGERTIMVQDTAGNMVPKTINDDRQYDQIKKILVKEKWFFDKNYSTLQVRILGICPIRVFAKEIKGVENTDESTAEMSQVKVCWVYYDEARNLFASHPVYNRFNDAQQISFDDLFMQRRFSGFIYAESNVYDNRLVSNYTTGIETLIEGERIKESITNLEHDLWEY
jgi:gliding motility associated protien GldN